MNFELGNDEFRAEVERFFEEHVDAEALEREHRTGDGHDWELHRKLARRGWVAASWPKAYGGQDRDPYELTVLEEAFRRYGYPRIGASTSRMIGNTLRVLGSEQQKREFLPRIARGELTICLGYTEPSSGSDVAAAQTRAVPDADGWVINGQKIFTTTAHLATYVFLLTRTNPDGPKHRGLTMFLVPLDTPGIEVQPVHTVGGERSNLVFYSDVRVPDSARVGEVDGGWSVLATALQIEQGIGFYATLELMLERVERWAHETRRDGAALIDDPLVREQLARARTYTEVARLLNHRVVWVRAEGRTEGVVGPMNKLFSAEKMIECAAALFDLVGPDALERRGFGELPGVEADHRFAQGTSIYGGSSEVMRSIIAESHLGLPRSRGK